MKGKNDILSERIRERLKDFEQPVSDDIWANIEEDLIPSVAIFRRKAVWKRLSMAASFLLILALGTLFFVNRNERKQYRAEKTETKPGPTPPAKETHQKKMSAVITDAAEIKSKQPDLNSHGKYSSHITGTEEVLKTDILVVKTHSQVSGESEKKKPEGEEIQAGHQNRKSSSFSEDAKIADNNLWRNTSGRKKKQTGISYALAIGNSGNFRNEAQQPYGQYYGIQNSPAGVSPNAPLFQDNSEKKELTYEIARSQTIEPTNYDFDFPISAGFTIRKQFSGIFALETGLVYTHLSSKATTTPAITNTTNLHYLGIPVKAVFLLYDTGRLSVYASAGGMVEKTVAGESKFSVNEKTGTQNLNIKNLQWSASGSVGINYRLINHLGIFLEPGAGYYFDDGSPVMTIRKDQPLSFTLQGGLRLTY